ncbi:MAG TPA: replication-associated recombination protein A [Patescibacteria group bacterium]|nr:replication-associated recombination protein A [Patescibacteria group bacterium]
MINNKFQPLANRLRPETFSDFVGQKNIAKANSFLRLSLKKDKIPSLIFWGPPGSGKTTLAFLIAKESKSNFIELSAVSSGLKDLREVITRAQEDQRLGTKTILFIDEIHRWNKSQQDALLPHIEKGTVILIGATTENPSFEINSALLSRAQVLVLEALENKDIEKILNRALKETNLKIEIKVLKKIASLADGDARQALNILEKLDNSYKKVGEKELKEILDKPQLFHDKGADSHYNLISALHKSIRGSDADASVYWLARIIEGGEDPIYVARRLLRFASEDVGLANNSALLLANNVFDACKKIGLPECKVHLAQLVIYLAKSKKNITAYQAYNKAQAEVYKSGNLAVPKHIRNAPTDLMKELDYGKGYKYSPLEDSSDQEYLPEKIKDKKFL